MTDTEPFEAFMRKYQNMVYSTAMRLLANETEAQDMAQEVFLKAYERFAELKESPTAGGFLKTVTTNLCLNYLSRYRARWRFFSEFIRGDEDEELPFEVAAPETLGQELRQAEQRQLLEGALAKLPPGQRVPLVLYHFEDKSYEEIAALLDISLSKVKTDIFRAREALRKRLQGQVASEEGWPSAKPSKGQPGRIAGRETSGTDKCNRWLAPQFLRLTV